MFLLPLYLIWLDSSDDNDRDRYLKHEPIYAELEEMRRVELEKRGFLYKAQLLAGQAIFISTRWRHRKMVAALPVAVSLELKFGLNCRTAIARYATGVLRPTDLHINATDEVRFSGCELTTPYT